MFNKSLGVFSIAAVLLGCGSTQTTTTTKVADRGVVTNEYQDGDWVKVSKTLKCDAPVAKVSIAPLKCQAAQCKPLPEITGNLAIFASLAKQELGPDFSRLGDSLSAMLSSSLEQSGCFDVLDRDAIQELRQEMELAGKEFKPDTADYLITGSISSLTYEQKETGIAGTGMTLGVFSNKESSAKMGLDIRMIDVNSSSVVLSETYLSNAKANEYAFGLSNNSGSALATFEGDIEVEEAARTVVNTAVADVVKYIAKDDYKEESFSLSEE